MWTVCPSQTSGRCLILNARIPEPGPRDLLVRVEAVAVNPRDIKSRNTLRGTPEQPRIIGYDASGVVERVGKDVTLFRPGDAVFYAGVLDRPGSNAQFQRVDERIAGISRPRSAMRWQPPCR